MKRLMLIVFVVLMWCSCASHKEVAYLQGISDVEYSQDITIPYEVKIKPDDLIAIMVNSRDPELAQLFNLPLISYQVNSKLTGQNRVLGYLVDKSGCINFPQLGRIEIVGMSRTELTNYIESELRGRGLVIDPIVTVQYLNYRVSVIGEVNSPGTFDVESDRITIFDALSRAGDMTIYGERDRVKIVREEFGRRVVATVDLRSYDIMNSPYYYLQQNDVVYVEPNRAKAGQRKINQNRTLGTFAAIVSVVLSALALAL